MLNDFISLHIYRKCKCNKFALKKKKKNQDYFQKCVEPVNAMQNQGITRYNKITRIESQSESYYYFFRDT